VPSAIFIHLLIGLGHIVVYTHIYVCKCVCVYVCVCVCMYVCTSALYHLSSRSGLQLAFSNGKLSFKFVPPHNSFYLIPHATAYMSFFNVYFFISLDSSLSLPAFHFPAPRVPEPQLTPLHPSYLQ